MHIAGRGRCQRGCGVINPGFRRAGQVDGIAVAVFIPQRGIACRGDTRFGTAPRAVHIDRVTSGLFFAMEHHVAGAAGATVTPRSIGDGAGLEHGASAAGIVDQRRFNRRTECR